MRILAAILVGLLAAGSACAQGGFSMRPDPNAIFNSLAKGKEYITRSDMDGLPEMWRGRAYEMFDRTVKELNITNGQLTREQYKTAFEQSMSRARNGANQDAVNRFTEDRFRSLDKNGDGLLQVDEMPDTLKPERDKWDTNKDGFIDLAEYKAFAQARFADRNAERQPSSSGSSSSQDQPAPIQIVPSDSEPESRPVVYRAGRLPKELPAWFAQNDTDQDGQVGLYEWVKAGKSVSEFREMDSNDDGFLTAEEVIRFLKVGKAPTTTASSSSSTPIGPSGNSTSGRTPPPGGEQRRGGWGGGWGGGRGRPGGGGERRP